MSLEATLESLENEARKQSEDILARAASQAEKLLAEAREDGEQIMASIKKATGEDLRSQAAKVSLETRLKAKKRVAEAKETLIDQVFTEAQGRIRSLRNRPIYEEVFGRLIDEALGEANGRYAGLTLRVNPRDVALAKTIFATRHPPSDIQIMGHDDIESGVAVLLDGGRKTGVNTLESRFQQAKQLLRTRVGAILFNDDN